jgi:16S rRNA (cytidine1402-2'-O)-methyltransferase
LQDITQRALQILRDVDLIACEDTRHSRRLLDHFGIVTPLVSYHEHNERTRAAELAQRLSEGGKVALISDAGTPLISDPGYRLVNAALSAGAAVIPVPGPSALLAALASSGLPTDAFYFGGFLPAKAGARRRLLETVGELDTVLVFYEAPHRIVETLALLADLFAEREIAVARELTKLHEEIWRGMVRDASREFSQRPVIRGEFVLVIGKPPTPAASDIGAAHASFQRHLAAGLSRMEAIKAAARECKLPKRDVYKLVGEGE